ncbi:cation:proton antiporter [Nocardia coubleae]|uniref:Cation/H(+) antiporter n=1 Tax=Nocardia coubleae TaxID=356147 RepID=A0A846WF06_9NOCA|nr:cation:proton antiporter [Nocardia coubleae]NKX91214.1 cation/H(+) antiporter [Nocardia coubleae]
MPNSTLVMVLVDLVIIMIAARVFGRLAEKLGQPAVIGEITAGILAGPTLLGPHLSQVLFPPDARPVLSVLANLGVVAFMFLAGLEVDRNSFTNQRAAIPAIATAAYLAPFGFGCLIAATALTRHHTGANTVGFVLFIGCALAVTAFPVLARILVDRNIIRTPIGQMSLACAAIVDAAAWIALAVVLMLVAPTGGHWRWALLAPLAVLVWWGARPVLDRLAAAGTGQQVLVLAIGTALLLAAVTEWIGLHLIFGAFAAGLIFPRAHRDSAENGAVVVSTLLLPAFFAVAGLSVDLGMLDTTGVGELAVVLAAAVGAKIASVVVVGRLAGLDTRTAAALAALLNTRGLTELVILHVGLTAGLTSTSLYSLLVVMALITTAMTAPLLHRIHLPHKPIQSQDFVRTAKAGTRQADID